MAHALARSRRDAGPDSADTRRGCRAGGDTRGVAAAGRAAMDDRGRLGTSGRAGPAHGPCARCTDLRQPWSRGIVARCEATARRTASASTHPAVGRRGEAPGGDHTRCAGGTQARRCCRPRPSRSATPSRFLAPAPGDLARRAGSERARPPRRQARGRAAPRRRSQGQDRRSASAPFRRTAPRREPGRHRGRSHRRRLVPRVARAGARRAGRSARRTIRRAIALALPRGRSTVLDRAGLRRQPSAASAASWSGSSAISLTSSACTTLSCSSRVKTPRAETPATPRGEAKRGQVLTSYSMGRPRDSKLESA